MPHLFSSHACLPLSYSYRKGKKRGTAPTAVAVQRRAIAGLHQGCCMQPLATQPSAPSPQVVRGDPRQAGRRSRLSRLSRRSRHSRIRNSRGLPLTPPLQQQSKLLRQLRRLRQLRQLRRMRLPSQLRPIHTSLPWPWLMPWLPLLCLHQVCVWGHGVYRMGSQGVCA